MRKKLPPNFWLVSDRCRVTWFSCRPSCLLVGGDHLEFLPITFTSFLAGFTQHGPPRPREIILKVAPKGAIMPKDGKTGQGQATACQHRWVRGGGGGGGGYQQTAGTCSEQQEPEPASPPIIVDLRQAELHQTRWIHYTVASHESCQQKTALHTPYSKIHASIVACNKPGYLCQPKPMGSTQLYITIQ